MFIEHKCYFKLKYYSALDSIMLFLIRVWRGSLESRIDFNRFDQDLSQKIDTALDAEEVAHEF
ncbi:hypothetical protein JCM14469_26720 [Desulfatiferula olefinivorans]